MSEERYQAFYREQDPEPLNDHGISLEFEVPHVVDGDYNLIESPHAVIEHEEVAQDVKRHLRLVTGDWAVNQLVEAA